MAGRAKLIEAVAARLMAPGIGIDAGGVSGTTMRILCQGLFLAPQTTGEALKGGRLTAEVLSREGFNVTPVRPRLSSLPGPGCALCRCCTKLSWPEAWQRDVFLQAPGLPPNFSMITAIEMGSRERMVAFCKGIQQLSPVGSYISPEPGEG